jgi:hypothetical protein
VRHDPDRLALRLQDRALLDVRFDEAIEGLTSRQLVAFF